MTDSIGSLLSAFSGIFGRLPGDQWEPSGEELAEILQRLQLRVERSAIRSGPYGGDRGSAARLAANKFARSVSRRKLRRFKDAAGLRRPMNLRKELLLARYRGSKVLDRLVPDRERRWRPIIKRVVRSSPKSSSLRNFSFLDYPRETLAAFKAISELEGQELNALLHFDDDFCLDAGAYLVLAEVWHSVRHTLAGGRMPKSIQKVLAATGVGEHNRMRLHAVDDEEMDDPEKTEVWAFPLRRRRAAGTSKSKTVHLDPQSFERTADAFCDEVDRWLGVPAIDRELTDEGRRELAQIIGELLCNAERHSQTGSDDGDWSTTAFMVRRVEEGVPTLRCYMAFLSIGRSISESLIDAGPHIRGALDRYSHFHRACGLSKATLETVFALQDTVTRDPEAAAARSGGTGLQDVLDMVNALGGTAAAGREPRVTVVSGSSSIRMRPPYIQGIRPGEPHTPRLLWFNPENKREVAPDGGFVEDLPDHFAGTLVTVAFTLDPAYFAAHMESDDEDDRS